MPVSVTNPLVSDQLFISPSDPRATDPLRPPGQDRDKSVMKSKDKKGKSTGKSKGKKIETTTSSSTGKSSALVSDLSTTGKPSLLASETNPPITKVDVPGPMLQHYLGMTTHISAAASAHSFL